jgi:hypothetical protein
MAWFFCTALYSFSIINFGKIIIFTSLSYKGHLINYVANLILYNYGGSSLHVLSFKALIQGTCPGDFCMAWSFFAPGIFWYFLCKFRNNHHIHEPTVQKPFNQLRCKLDFVQLWRVYFTCLKF